MPRTHLHFAYACSAASGPTYALYALQTMEVGGALCGFELPVWSRCQVEDESGEGYYYVNQALHASTICDMLLSGYTVEQAVNAANTEYVPGWPIRDQDDPEEFTWVPRPMKVRGDGETTLIWVYLSEADRLLHLQLTDEPFYADWKHIRWGPGN